MWWELEDSWLACFHLQAATGINAGALSAPTFSFSLAVRRAFPISVIDTVVHKCAQSFVSSVILEVIVTTNKELPGITDS